MLCSPHSSVLLLTIRGVSGDLAKVMKVPVDLLRLCVLCATLPSAAQDAILQATVRDEFTGQPSACTVAITDAKGHLLTETDSFKTGFRCEGQFTKKLPPGTTRIRITRGFETRFLEQELDLKPASTNELTFILRRICDLRKRGWYGGDSHVHMLHGERTVPVSFDFVALTARAEDLQYLSLAQAWEIADPTPEALETELRPRSRPDCMLTWNLEAPKNYYKGDARRCLGHCWNLGLSGRTAEGSNVINMLQEASAWDYESQKPTYANFESHQLIHKQGGAVFYTHPERWWTGSWGGRGGYPKVDRMRVSNMAVELPLDTILGPTFDGLDVITGPGEAEANEKAFQLWVMLLNHGYRIAATGSSDACFDRPGGAAPGVPRTYTFVSDGFSLPKITRATAAGHTFVTTGPLLVATLDGQPPGSSFGLGTRQHTLAVEAWAAGESAEGLERMDVLRDGETFRQYVFSDHPDSIRTNFNFQEENQHWYCVRLWESGPKRMQAITSAFYFGEGSPVPASAAIVHVKILDGISGQLQKGTVTEVTFFGTIGRDGKRHTLSTGEERLQVPGTVRLRAEAPGYEPVILSPVLDNSALVNMVTSLSDTNLLEWKTFEEMRQKLAGVEMEFKLRRAEK